MKKRVEIKKENLSAVVDEMFEVAKALKKTLRDDLKIVEQLKASGV